MSLEYLLGDHLGSTALTTDANGAKVSDMRYCAASHRDKPFGELRYAWTDAPANTSPVYALTRYTFTGQYAYLDDPTTSGSEGFGLMFYNARWYDPVTGRFAQADSIVPAGAQGLDRYAYVNNNPLRFTDPSGHRCVPGDGCDTSHGDKQEGVNFPTSVDSSKLDDIRGKTGISGRDFYNFYLYLYNSPRNRWWWKKFGSDGFNIEDAYAVIFYYETNNNWSNTNNSEASSRLGNEWCHYTMGIFAQVRNL